MRILLHYMQDPRFPWIGSQRLVEVLTQGLKKLGHDAIFSDDLHLVPSVDLVLIHSICNDLNPITDFIRLMNKPYVVIPFHEDYLLYSSVYKSFFSYIANAIQDKMCEDKVEMLYRMPEIVRYIHFEPRVDALVNFEVMENADAVFANSHTEADTITRYCPRANVKIAYLTAGFLEQKSYDYSDIFIKKFGLTKGNYILQIGRLEPRKNQLATILATRNIDIPVVFIATSLFDHNKAYAETCLKAILKFRKAPTMIITHSLEERNEGPLQIRNIQGGLSVDYLVSAYQNAGLHCHPAFYELPGYIYLEAAKLGVPTIASEWTTIKDYFTDRSTNKYTLDDRIQYCLPYHLPQIESLVRSHFGKTYAPSDHPIFERRDTDFASDFLASIE